MRHATALLYHVCAVASRKIRSASCGTSGKLTLWTRYVSSMDTYIWFRDHELACLLSDVWANGVEFRCWKIILSLNAVLLRWGARFHVRRTAIKCVFVGPKHVTILGAIFLHTVACWRYRASLKVAGDEVCLWFATAKYKLRVLSPRASYTDRATATDRRS
jgi:hypothetical protein